MNCNELIKREKINLRVNVTVTNEMNSRVLPKKKKIKHLHLIDGFWNVMQNICDWIIKRISRELMSEMKLYHPLLRDINSIDTRIDRYNFKHDKKHVMTPKKNASVNFIHLLTIKILWKEKSCIMYIYLRIKNKQKNQYTCNKKCNVVNKRN